MNEYHHTPVSSTTQQFLKQARPSQGEKNKRMVELEQEYGKDIKELLAAPLTCRLRWSDKCGVCVKCLYGLSETQAVRWRKKLGIKGRVGTPKAVYQEDGTYSNNGTKRIEPK